jgi:hypothetical protein
MSSYRGFRDGQKVTHRTWKNREGTGPATGTVRVFELSEEEIEEGCARAEVAWHGSFVADELDLVAKDIY